MVENIEHLFVMDDGSLPDIHVKNLSPENIHKVYTWIRHQCKIVGEPMVWSCELNCDVPLESLANPVNEMMQGNIEPFRHLLGDLQMGGVEIPQLSVAVSSNSISFDYKKGVFRGEAQIEALFEFLSCLQDLVGEARIFQTEEGQHKNPNLEFTAALSNIDG